MNRRIRGKINSGEVGALYDNGRKNKTTAKCKWVYTRNACRKNECVPFGDCKMGSGKLKLFGLKNRNLCVEVMVVKKKVTIVFVITGILAISTMIIFSTYKSSEAYRKAKAKTQWECSVVCAEKSTPDSYVITYSDAKILSNTGVLTVQNRNDFDITVHLLCEGKQELVSDSIPAGGCYSFQNVTDKEYTVGIHAEVDENTDIKAFVYDGKDTEPYTR